MPVVLGIESSCDETAVALVATDRRIIAQRIASQDEAHRPVMVGLGYFFQLQIAWGEVMAYLTLISVPVIAFYLVMQRAFISSIASTGVKG